jgi:hypothetical protein
MVKKTDYKEIGGTFYKNNTHMDLIEVLERARKNRTRIVVDYGDIKTKKSWGEVYDISGYIGRSTGEIKIPILLNNSRSIGGVGLLDDCILSVKTSKGKQTLYQLK